MSQEATNNHETAEYMDSSNGENLFPTRQVATASTEADKDEELLENNRFRTTPLKTVRDLFEQNQYAPPQATLSERPIDEIAAEWNSLANHHEWNTLNEIEKVKAAFLLIKKQHELIRKDPNCNIQNLIEAVMDPESAFGKRLDAFVRKGGDEEDCGDSGHSKFADFLERHPEWGSEKTETKVTIFDVGVKPFLRYQQEDSTICNAVVVANAIYYLGELQELQRRKKSTSVLYDVEGEEPNYKHVNVCRYMRNRFSPEEIFSNIFRGDCGHLEPHVKRLLQDQNPGKKVTRDFAIFPATGRVVFSFFSYALQTNGALMIEALKVTQELVHSDELLFRAPWQAGPSTQFLTPNHSVLVVGVRLVNGDLEFLIQDSWEHKPFFVVSLATLESMGIEDLYGIRETVCFSPRELIRFEEEAILGSLTRWSPSFGPSEQVDTHTGQSEQQEESHVQEFPKGYFTIYAGPGTSLRT